jgi:predicted regulator of Ras-like GTPase activity (Roadblock/LC7/MglB family)
MNFDHPLEKLRKDSPEVRDAALIGLDGVVIARAGLGDGEALEAAAAALADVLRKAAAANRAAELGEPQEMVLATPAGTVVVRPVGTEYAVLALVESGGLSGRARHAVRLAAAAFEPELA